jgi:hypothetical protein
VGWRILVKRIFGNFDELTSFWILLLCWSEFTKGYLLSHYGVPIKLLIIYNTWNYRTRCSRMCGSDFLSSFEFNSFRFFYLSGRSRASWRHRLNGHATRIQLPCCSSVSRHCNRPWSVVPMLNRDSSNIRKIWFSEDPIIRTKSFDYVYLKLLDLSGIQCYERHLKKNGIELKNLGLRY